MSAPSLYHAMGRSKTNNSSTGSSDSSRRGEVNEWPASDAALQAARTFLTRCASERLGTLIVPDKDADGLCASAIIHRTLTRLGLPSDLISVHFVAKGDNVHTSSERGRMEAYGDKARRVIVVDQGSRPGGPLVRGDGVETLIVDHHWTNSGGPEDYPEGALVLSAAHHPPVATSSTLAYVLCRPLFGKEGLLEMDYLCVMGTYGDLGASYDFGAAPVSMREEMQACVRRCTKTALTQAVSLLNAPRRTATYDVCSVWQALQHTSHSPQQILCAPRLSSARKEVNEEVSRVARNRPYFSGDGRVALIRVSSGAQVHPVIATRWSSSLKSKKLEIVMCANNGYLPGMTNFSCRIAKCAQGGAGDKVNIIEVLTEYAAREDGLREAMGENFARGHKEASGGIVPTELFERLWAIMLASEPEAAANEPAGKKRKSGAATLPAQKNTLDNWLKR